MVRDSSTTQLDPEEVYGKVCIQLKRVGVEKYPDMSVMSTAKMVILYDFGARPALRLHNAQKELSKTITKDVAVARKAVQDLAELVQLEVGAGVAATKNVAVQMSRDLQVFANSAASVFHKAAAAGNHTARMARKDLELAHQDLKLARKEIVKASSNLEKAAKDAGKAVMTTVTGTLKKRLSLAGTRALMLKNKLLRRKAGKCACGSKSSESCACTKGKSCKCSTKKHSSCPHKQAADVKKQAHVKAKEARVRAKQARKAAKQAVHRA
jgi:hypothetical protein